MKRLASMFSYSVIHPDRLIEVKREKKKQTNLRSAYERFIEFIQINDHLVKLQNIYFCLFQFLMQLET